MKCPLRFNSNTYFQYFGLQNTDINYIRDNLHRHKYSTDTEKSSRHKDLDNKQSQQNLHIYKLMSEYYLI